MDDRTFGQIERRRENFGVKAYPGDRFLADEFELSITQDGHQWHTVSLLPFEAEKVIAELQRYLARVGTK